ncbi:MAG: type II toxin-antitoxin system prevent-host-death family antitoxin [Ignavibacteria bacterium]|nr:type II toxin-antitoxin system prevent-host-death family antitoxin [Ignavibacteria bacterium]
MTYTLTIAEAKQKLEELITSLDGNDVILTSNGVPMAKILPITLPNTYLQIENTDRSKILHAMQAEDSTQKSTAQLVRKAGSSEGLIIYMADDFDAPLDEFKDYGK